MDWNAWRRNWNARIGGGWYTGVEGRLGAESFSKSCRIRRIGLV